MHKSFGEEGIHLIATYEVEHQAQTKQDPKHNILMYSKPCKSLNILKDCKEGH